MSLRLSLILESENEEKIEIKWTRFDFQLVYAEKEKIFSIYLVEFDRWTNGKSERLTTTRTFSTYLSQYKRLISAPILIVGTEPISRVWGFFSSVNKYSVISDSK